MTRPKPRGLSWRESGTDVLLSPHWGHHAGAALVISVSMTIIVAIMIQPATGPEPRLTWGLGTVIAVSELLMVVWFTYPWWGRARLSFADGIFRVDKVLSLTVSELERFTVEPTPAGVTVFAVKNDGTRIPLPLPLGNPLTTEDDKWDSRKAIRANHHRAESEYAATRLTALLEQSRRAEPATYRK